MLYAEGDLGTRICMLHNIICTFYKIHKSKEYVINHTQETTGCRVVLTLQCRCIVIWRGCVGVGGRGGG